MNPYKIFMATLFSKPTIHQLNRSSIYNIEINTIDGKPLNFSDFKGKYMLIVNVASKCGFTSQYKALQDLYNTHKEKLIVIGVPCNQFGNQEPGDAETITSFCKINYGVTFPITEKVDVKGTNQHPLYAWLTQKLKNGVKNSKVKWNFQKYILDTNGELIDHYYSTTLPTSAKITKHIK
ncbi:glutathione peroxidase [uncultured Psychroserpens sp.]|uniref:glutathione peroxidase n=1 Tax=uncultured Psychroserpens sp. TaxID=255436 RepID=UPI002623C26B|nr:glutathione peroxidase [uncultured Psychroserpens sp.]